MKLVINTQVLENYGDAEQPIWKNKFGDTYVVYNLTDLQVARFRNGADIPNLRKLIEFSNSAIEEYITSFYLAEDEEEVCEKWETPYTLEYRDGAWQCSRVVRNDTEYGYMREDIQRKEESWTMLPEGERDQVFVRYYGYNGEVITN